MVTDLNSHSGTTAPDEPYLSVVATARNDNHGGDLSRRMQIFVDALAEQCERHELDAELVIVEWNPPLDRPRLADVLRWPVEGSRCTIRIVEVPPELHATLEHADRLPLFQMIAKNVGIRRARGRFVLATNVDLLFSDELMSFIAARGLKSGQLYRTDRYDARSELEVGAPVADQLAYCRRNLIRICKREGTYDVESGRFYRIYENLRVPLWLAPWIRLGRLADRKVELLTWRLAIGVFRLFRLVVRGGRFLVLTIYAGVRALRGRRAHRVVRWFMRERVALAGVVRRAMGLWRLRLAAAEQAERRSVAPARWRFLRQAWLSERSRLRLHTNACGDFTLASRELWQRTGAYPELELFSMHLDSLFLYQAHYTGARERFLPFPVYHLEHESGFKPDDKSIDQLNDRLERKAIPQISNEQFLTWVIQMYRTKRPVFTAPANWGFADEDLPETAVASARTMDVVA
ncbi:MAG: hypothetical protein H0V45_14685 [Actinobacteria bacterium]|nr:hypothetical protein [Actinomycetota bacterium]